MHGPPRFRYYAVLALAWCLVGLSFRTNADGLKTKPDSAASSHMVSIVLKEKAVVGLRRYTIADLADLSGGAAPLRERLGAIDLGEFAGNETTALVKPRQVDFRLRLADVPEQFYRVTGEPCHVILVQRPVTADEVFNAARDAAIKRMPWSPDDLAVRLVQPITALLPTGNRDEVQLKAEPHGQNIQPGRVQMDVTIWVRGEKKTAIPVYLEIKVVQRTAIARFALNRGDVITEESVLIDRRSVEPGVRALSPEKVVGRKLRRPIAAGHVVQAVDVEEPEPGVSAVLIRNRQPVKMTVRIGTIDVTADGRAEQDGKLGDRIRLTNTESKKPLTGKVTGVGTVEVDP